MDVVWEWMQVHKLKLNTDTIKMLLVSRRGDSELKKSAIMSRVAVPLKEQVPSCPGF